MSYFNRYVGFVRLSALLAVMVAGMTGTVLGQDKGKYLLGEDNKLEIVVHIMGEVKRPGKYRVRDNTNLVDLLSEAGGPTEFSKLSSITITHAGWAPTDGENGANHEKSKRISRFDFNKYLKDDKIVPAPILQPGDVVLVPSNSWRTWRTVATILRDIAIVASAYFLYLRAAK